MGVEPQSPVESRPTDLIRRDLFISYASSDLDAAHALRVALEANGYSCWMAPDDIVGSGPWAEQLAAAIAGCRAMLVLVSEASVASRHVPKEAELAFDKTKPLIPLRLDDARPTGSLEYLLSLTQWFDAFPGPLDAHIEGLLARIGRALDETTLTPTGPAPSTMVPSRIEQTAPPLLKPRSGARKARRIVVALLALTTLVVSLLSFLRADALTMLQAREFRVSPDPVRAGATATAIGRDWATGTPVEIQWGAAYGSVVGNGTSDVDGSFSIAFTVPVGATPGDYEVWACQYAAGTDCSPSNEFKAMNSTIVRVAADTPPVANPDRLVTMAGTSLVIPDDLLTGNDADPDGDALCSSVRVIDGPSRGSLTRITDTDMVYIPDGIFVGSDAFTYQVCDSVNSAWSNVTTVTIDVVFEGSISLDPASGVPGTRVRVSGHGFPVDAQLDVFWEGTRVATTATDGAGTFSADVTVGDVAPNDYTIVACISDTGLCASAVFAVASPPPAMSVRVRQVSTSSGMW